jgi:hypothetical protein
MVDQRVAAEKQNGSAYGSNAYGAASGAFAQGTWTINPSGQRVQRPADCAYPRYDSGGVAVFQRFGCRLP